jgi:hypothetical protein
MKSKISLAIFLVGMVFGSMMIIFENPLGDYIVAASVLIGLYSMSPLEKE